jgi:hypothetical protein
MITKSDDLYFGVVYAQSVLHVRPDVIAVTWTMMGYPWYRQRIAERGAKIEDGAPGEVASVRFATRLLAAGHAVYVDRTEANILAMLPSYPYAGLLRVLPRGAPLPKLDAIVAENHAAFAAFDLDEPTPSADDGYPTVAHLRYADTWQRISQAYAADGYPEAAAAALDTAVAVGPQLH